MLGAITALCKALVPNAAESQVGLLVSSWPLDHITLLEDVSEIVNCLLFLFQKNRFKPKKSAWMCNVGGR